AVGAFDDGPRLHVRGDLVGDRVLHGGGNQDVALAGEQVLVCDRVAAGEISQRAVFPVEKARRLDVDAGLVKDAARLVADGDDGGAAVIEQLGRVVADVAETL